MGYETLKVKKEGGVAVITLSRPDKLNALNPKMGEELVEVLDEISKDDTVRAVVITGEGRAFCAGGDVREDIAPLSELSPFEFTEYFERMMDAYKKIVKMDKPVIAAVNGYAVGAGLDLMMSCDIRIASEEAKLGQFFVRMGLTPEVGVWLMPRL
ncbi:MAG TPA: enoyl-CoA hydratase/isomerase family protein, partial [Methanomicrobia archaeon]|nr:enoyl-CoA hydratase/isomerase family protein [Methanomicrobia archaeon]HEX59345.1 enoyl-CoA hydratase/isomerase family protein [Methanomicrobia archaeon]